LKNATLIQKNYYDRKSKNREFEVGQSVWLYNPKRRVGRTPKLDKSWEGPYGIVTLIGPVLAEIQRCRSSKPKIVHVDKLAPTKVPVKMDWVHQLPTKSEQKDLDNNLEGIKQLFNEVVQNDSSNDEPNSTNASGDDVSTKRVTRSGKTY
jgi:hypothetical protein